MASRDTLYGLAVANKLALGEVQPTREVSKNVLSSAFQLLLLDELMSYNSVTHLNGGAMGGLSYHAHLLPNMGIYNFFIPYPIYVIISLFVSLFSVVLALKQFTIIRHNKM